MAQKSKIATDTNNELGLSDLHVRINFLEKENTKLIQQITSRKSIV